ncbi:MAG: sugar phosphate isomerase/epimerase family protein [Planctomycetota bacterium]
MKYAICNEMYGDLPFAEVFAHAAQLGYQGIEIAPFTLVADPTQDPTAVDGKTIEQIRDLAQQHQLEIVGLHWLLAKTNELHLTTADDATRRRTADYLIRLVELCSRLGGSLMVFGSPQQRNLEAGLSAEQGMANACEVFQAVVPALEQHQVTLALEPLGPKEGNFLLTADDTVELIQRIGSPSVALHLDVKAMSSESMPIPEIIKKHHDNLHHFHANDPNLLGPGMGDVDFLPIFKALADVDYKGWVSVEVFDFSPGVDRLAQDSIQYMKSVTDQLTDT